MGAIGGMLGLSGGASGTGFAAPQQANLQTPTTAGQAQTAYGQNQAALGSQQQLLQALQGQNGLGNQSQVYGQLQGIASGAVNPAQAQFAQNTGQNVANQAALMAGQRGAGANVGLMARQAAQQGAGIQQQAAGQEAAQQAQNQIAAIGQAGQLATTQAGQQIGQVNANVGAQQAEQVNLLNALGQQNQAVLGSQQSVNAGNVGLGQTQMGGQQGLIGGLLNGAGLAGKAALGGGGAGAAGAAQGGVIGMADGGVAPGAQSSFGKFLSGVSAPAQNNNGLFSMSSSPGAKSLQSGAQSFAQGIGSAFQSTPSAGNYAGSDTAGFAPNTASQGGKVDVVVSPGEKIVPPGEAKKCAQGGKPKMQTVPGKAEVKGDSLKNDKVPTKLEPGTVVVKRTRANNNPEGFIKEVLSKRKGSK